MLYVLARSSIIDKNISILTEDKFVKLKISLPFISKGNSYNAMEFLVTSVEVKENDLFSFKIM